MQNINTVEYFNEFFKERTCEKERLLRQEKYLELVGEGRIVELASGLSYFLQMAKAKYPKSECWGIDFSTVAKEKMSKESSLESSVNYVVGNALDTPFKDNYFDYVVSGEFVEHLENPIELFKEMHRICKTGGLMIISTPHLEFDDPEHLWKFEAEDIIKLFEEIGAKNIKHELLKSDIEGRYYIICYAENV